MAREVKVAIIGDAKGFGAAVNDADGHLGKLGSRLGSFAKTAAIGLGAAAVGAVAMGKSFYDAAVESQKVTKQTEAVLKSMGNQAGLTADDVAKLSTKLSMQSGVDDELIQSASNVLLTFGKVRNEVGKGNDIFNRAQQSALDMSVALGTDLQGATIMLGKALNDPVKGITAMTRAGVSFTQQQKDQIKTMVASGDTLGAQKLIMAEMEKQFGGSAAAQATAADKLKVVFGNLQETVGGYLLPVVEKLAGFLANNLPGAFEAVGAVAGPIFEAIRQGVAAFTSAWSYFDGEVTSSGVNGKLEEFGFTARTVFENFKAALTEVVGWVQENWPKIQQVISEVMATVGAVIGGAVDVIMTLWNNFGNNILELIQRVWPNILQVIQGVMNTIQGLIKIITGIIHGDWSQAWEGIKQVFGGVWNAIQGIVKIALEELRYVIGVALEVIGSVVKGAFDGMVDLIKSLPGRMKDAAGDIWGFLKSGLQTVINGIIRGLEWMVNQVVNAINKAIDAADVIAGPFVNFDEVKPVTLPRVTLHGGGLVPGTPGAEVPALLQAGELVLNKAQQQGLGTSVVFNIGNLSGGSGAIDELDWFARSKLALVAS